MSKKMTKKELLVALGKLGACGSAVNLVKKSSGTPRQIFNNFKTPALLLWLLDRVEASPTVMRNLAADFATEATAHLGPDEVLAAAWCISISRQMANGFDIDPEESDAARYAVSYAARYANDASYAARYATRCANDAVQCKIIRSRITYTELEFLIRMAVRDL